MNHSQTICAIKYRHKNDENMMLFVKSNTSILEKTKQRLLTALNPNSTPHPFHTPYREENQPWIKHVFAF